MQFVEVLRRALHTERATHAAAKLKNEEMTRLIKDQKVTIEAWFHVNRSSDDTRWHVTLFYNLIY